MVFLGQRRRSAAEHPFHSSRGPLAGAGSEFFSPARRRWLLLIAIRPRNSAIRCFLLYFQQTPALPLPMVAPVPAQISKLPCRKLSGPTRRSYPNSRPVNPLQPLCRYSVAPVLCFQQLAASFHKTPGWGVPRFPFQPPRPTHYSRPAFL